MGITRRDARRIGDEVEGYLIGLRMVVGAQRASEIARRCKQQSGRSSSQYAQMLLCALNSERDQASAYGGERDEG